jgi:hypothetical protein
MDITNKSNAVCEQVVLYEKQEEFYFNILYADAVQKIDSWTM